MVTYPGEIWVYTYQQMPTKVTEMVDSDWAADQETRKSVTCSAERFGLHLLEVHCVLSIQWWP